MAIIDVIKYEGSNDVLVFKHPTVDFNRKAQLIVHEKQEAVVLMNGEAVGLYAPGRYDLESKNLPGVKHFVALISGGELANHCEVYFFNKLIFSNIPWVTSPMDIQDATIGNYYTFRGQGYFKVTIKNSVDLFKIMGQAEYFTVSDLKEYFSERISSTAKEVLSIAMIHEGLSYGEINSHLTKLSEKVFERISVAFSEIGLSLEEFKFDSVNLEKDAEFEKHRGHLGERQAQKIEGYTYDKKRMYDVMEAQAKNQGTAGTMGAMGAGAGFGMAMGQVYNGMVGGGMNNAFGNQSSQAIDPSIQATAGVVRPHEIRQEESGSAKCPACGEEINANWKSCPYCGSEISHNRKCPSCGETLPSNSKIRFCPSCGTAIN